MFAIGETRSTEEKKLMREREREREREMGSFFYLLFFNLF